jgi:hypothetical protein
MATDNDIDDLDEIFRNVDGEFTCKGKSQKFSKMMKDYETPMFLRCKKEHNKLHIVLILL